MIDEGRYKQAIREFTCVIEAEPTEVEGYRGRIEAQLLLGQYSNSVRDYARVTAVVTPLHPDAQTTILASYAARLETAPNDIAALTGASFARWWHSITWERLPCSTSFSISSREILRQPVPRLEPAAERPRRGRWHGGS